MAGRYMMRWSTVCVVLIAAASCRAVVAAQVSGELKKWHKVTFTFDGPKTAETAEPNPFLYYRLNVRFTYDKTGKSYLVPGYYVADGDAANTSADSGSKWRVHFAPSQTGVWKYEVSFRKGDKVTVAEGANAGQSAGFMDGQTGTLKIGPTDKTGRDTRAKGLLQYVGRHHLRFAETGEYFLKCGADAPENFLAYRDFDGDFKTTERYYVWLRAYSTGSEDNGLNVRIYGTRPASGRRLHGCEGKNSWRWESKQRTNMQHCGEPHRIFIEVEQSGLHTIEFSMREDGFEFDKWLMTKDRDFVRPEDTGLKERAWKK